MPYYYAEPMGALLQHSDEAFKFKQRLDFKRYTFLRTRVFSIVIRHSLPTKASFQKVYFFLGHLVQCVKRILQYSFCFFFKLKIRYIF